MSEALAYLFETMVEEPAWIQEITEGSPAEVAGWVRHARLRRATATAHDLFEASFERALYADPEADLEAVRRELGRRILGFDPMEEADLWPTNPIPVSYPAHHTAYTLAALAAEQLRAALGGTLWGNPHVGAWLDEHFYRPAGTRPWRESLQAASGAPLGVEAIARRLAEA